MLGALSAAPLLGCDQGKQQDEPVGAGGPIQVVGQFPVAGDSLPSDAAIELVFNRYLLPSSVTRQSISLQTAAGATPTNPANPGAVPAIAYDPVARIVTITPVPGSLTAGQSVKVVIDPNQLRAIDGASLASAQATTFDFAIVAGDGGAAPVIPQVDYCRDIDPIFNGGCAFCHTPTGTYAALSLSSPQQVASTAIGRTAHGANTGPTSTAEAPGPIFGVNMPIIDPNDGTTGGGNPANSWLMYKVLMAQPSATSAYVYTSCGTPTDVTALHAATQPAFSNEAGDPERANLANMIPGREMPYPGNPGAALDANASALTIQELERVNLWIAQGPDGGADAASFLPSGPCNCTGQ